MADEIGSDQESGLEEITEAELHQLAIQDRLLDFHTCMPGKVQSFDKAAQTVTVTLMFQRKIPDGEGGWAPAEAYTDLQDVPVGFYRGGGMFMSLPIAKGDDGMVIFAERNLGRWRSTGDQADDPGDVGMFTLDGAWFIPATAPDKKRLVSVDDVKMRIGRDDNPNAQIEIDTSVIALGQGATKGVNREGDGVDLGVWIHTPASGAGVTACTLAYQPPGASLPVPISTGTHVEGKTESGSAHVKAVD